MTPMELLLARLFAEATPLDNPLVKAACEGLPANATPSFLECQLVLRSGYAAAGVLTRTPEGTLRLMTIAKKADNTILMADHYFAHADVLTVVLGREMPRSLLQQVHAGKPIILGH